MDNIIVDKDRVEFEKLFCFKNLYKAHMRARCCKRGKDAVIAFEQNLGNNLLLLQREIYCETYSIKKYHRFFVYEPKKREIQSCAYRDRVAQHCLCDNFLIPLIDSKLIYDNCACRKNKGVDFAIKRTVKFMRSYYNEHGATGYVLRIDISKYFASIDKNVLLRKLSKFIFNRYVLALVGRILTDYPDKGLPIGNQISQMLAVFYMNDIDRMVKEKLGIKYYIRYMDDILIIHHDKEVLRDILEKITVMANENKLRINPKTSLYMLKEKIDFIGRSYYYNENGGVEIRLRAVNKRRLVRKLRGVHKQIKAKLIDYAKYVNILASYWGLLKRGHLRTPFYDNFLIDYNGLTI